MMRKGTEVLIDHEALAKRGNPVKDMLGDLYDPNIHSLGDNNDEIIKRSINGDNPKITSVVDDNYINLIYNDGFECGVEKKYIRCFLTYTISN
jgi:hypothetical protein